MEKLLLLEKVDFELSTNGKMITEMIDHQEKPDEQTKQILNHNYRIKIYNNTQ